MIQRLASFVNADGQELIILLLANGQTQIVIWQGDEAEAGFIFDQPTSIQINDVVADVLQAQLTQIKHLEQRISDYGWAAEAHREDAERLRHYEESY